MFPKYLLLFWLIILIIIIVPILLDIYVISKQYSCVDTEINWCKYFVQTNITIIGYKDNHAIGKYSIAYSDYMCKIHDYIEIHPIGYYFNGYYQKDTVYKCVNEKHYQRYISSKKYHSVLGDVVPFTILMCLIGFLIIVTLYKYMEPMVSNEILILHQEREIRETS